VRLRDAPWTRRSGRAEDGSPSRRGGHGAANAGDAPFGGRHSEALPLEPHGRAAALEAAAASKKADGALKGRCGRTNPVARNQGRLCDASFASEATERLAVR